MRITWRLVVALISIISLYSVNGQDMPPTTSLVYPSVDGRLVYVADSLGNIIPDFSNAGYKGDGVQIPFVPVRKTVWPSLGDNSAAIQNAIDEVASLPADASGFRGTVLLKMSTYSLEKPIYIKASGVVLRGEGRSDLGTILYARIPKESPGPPQRRPALINIGGETGVTPMEETRQSITDSHVPVGSKTLNIKLGKGYKPGDKVLVRRIGNQDWISAAFTLRNSRSDSATVR